MTLRAYQTAIELDTLYEVRSMGKGAEQLTTSIWMDAGSIDVYVSNSANPPASAPTDMNIISNGEGLDTVGSFKVLPSYIYVVQNTGTTTEIVLSGIYAEEVV